jgi:hypothetical protein
VHYKLEKVCKTEILRKLKQRFGGKLSATFAFACAERHSRGLAALLYNDRFFLLKLRQGNALRETKTGHES